MLRLSRAAGAAAPLLPLVLAACTGGGGGGAHASYPPPLRYTPPSPSPSPRVLTGTQLKGLLVTALPKGFAADPQAKQTTGDRIRTASVGPAPTVATCGRLDSNTFVEAAGIISVSSADLGFIGGDKTVRVAEQIDVFDGTDAPTVMARLDQAFDACATYTTTGSGQSITVHMAGSKVPVLGLDAVKADVSTAHSATHAAMVAARAGTAVVTVRWATTAASDKTADGYAVALTQEILRNVRAALQ